MILRRDLLKVMGVSGAAALLPRAVRGVGRADYTLEIARTTLDLSTRIHIDTVVYNGQAPGPVLRFKEGRAVTIEVTNRTTRPEIVHWHGLFLAPHVDGAAEEGTPFIHPGETVRYGFVPHPAGFRWYHTHTMAMNDLTLAQYGGQHGALFIEPREEAGRFDDDIVLILHDWQGYLSATDDGAMNPTYRTSTINGKILGAGEPLRVKQGSRVRLHVVNSSPTEVHWVALAGHRLHVIALDGNSVPTPASVPMLRVAPGERVSAIVEMNNPGVWIFGEVRKHIQAAGMGIVIEYADKTGAPVWLQPAALIWDYGQFAASQRVASDEPAGSATSDEPAEIIPLVIESKFKGHGAMEGWTINGKAYPEAGVPPLVAGRRYRLAFINKSRDAHPLHLHRHSFELCRPNLPLGTGDPGTVRERTGITKDVVLVEANTRTDVEFVADNPGPSLLHCHQQNHMDMGFMMLFRYA